MVIKSRYKLDYVISRESKTLILDVELIQPEGIRQPFQNVWEGYATLNGEPYEEEDLSHCVNAYLAAMRIGTKLRDELKNNAKKENKVFRIKNVDLK